MTYDALENSKGNEFTCDIHERVVEEIMRLKDVEDSWKILLLMGIGVFTNHKNSDYTEIMKNWLWSRACI